MDRKKNYEKDEIFSVGIERLRTGVTMEKHKYKDSKLPVMERVNDLLSKMTLEEKVAQMDMIRGVELATKVHEAHFCSVAENSDFYWDKVEESIGAKGIGFVHDVYSVPSVLNKLQKYFVENTRLGIPCIFTGEALHGISYPSATVFPMPINMASTFNRELVHEVGHAIAAETRGIGICEILAPNLDVARDARWGRVEETFGEDTYLSSQMAYAIITGEQGEDVSRPDQIVCEPKHYCVHGIPEGGTNCSPARVGIREVETCYLPVFEAGIKKAGAYNAMASYNCIDSEAVISSEHYLREVLKERFGMKGYARADFGAVNRLKNTHRMSRDNKESIEMAVNGGLDVQGFDFSNKFWQESLLELVKEGKIKEEIINDAVSRILRVKFDLGLFENPYTDEMNYKNVIRCEKHKSISYEVAKQSIVMLQNKNQILPLAKKINSIAVIGPSSATQRIGSYSSVPYGYEVSSVYQEIKKVADKHTIVRQSDGCGITEHDVELIPKSWYDGGILMEYFNNSNFEGDPVGTEQVDLINFNWILAKPHRDLEFNGYSVRMSGKLKINTHEFMEEDQFIGKLIFTTNDTVKVKIDGTYVIESYGDKKMHLPHCQFEFVNGTVHDFVIEYYCDVNGNDLSFCIDHHEDSLDKAIEIAKSCDTVVLVCGDNKVTSGEGMDRCELKLHGKQRELIEKVAELGKPTVLVLENGKPVDLSNEVKKIDGVLVSWFGGEFGAKAIVDVLFGSISPSGKLPMCFPKSTGHIPCYYTMLPGGSPWFLENNKEPLFWFGHGLSYTEFEYSDMNVQQLDGKYQYKVSFHVKNIGSMAADEVAQLYVSDLQSSIVTPLKTLQGFERISLIPGETKLVELLLDFDSFKLLNKKYQWVVEPGDFTILVGSGCNDIRLEQTIIIN
ncbi:MAG: hypothetical protein K0S47_351 [Herbinix sp.]|nr:hypothetical protein [Herbinix sp.]